MVGDTLDMPDGCSVRSKDLFSELVDDESHGLSSTLDTDLDDFEDIPSSQFPDLYIFILLYFLAYPFVLSTVDLPGGYF